EGSTRKSRTSIPSAAPTTMWKAPSQRSFSPRCRTSSTMRSPIIPPPRSYMADWVKRLDAFLQFNEEDILHDKGKVTAAIAKAFAEKEFEKFRVLQDRTYQS